MIIFEHAQICVKILTQHIRPKYLGTFFRGPPLANLTTKRLPPAGVSSGKTMTADNALQAVFNQLYQVPV